MSWSDFVRRDADGKVTVGTRGKPAPPSLSAVMWGEPLPPHTLESTGSTELHVIRTELKNTAGL